MSGEVDKKLHDTEQPEQPQKHFWELYFWVPMSRERWAETATIEQ